MDILDQILAEDRAKVYSDRKGGYTRKYGPDISWNGDTTGRFVLDDHFTLVSETAIDLTKVESIMMKSQNDDSSLVVDAGELTVEVVDENTSTITLKNVNNIICASSIAKDYTADDDSGNVYDCKKGTYFYFDESMYISYVKMKETIHPIDPNVLPGVCLPVVELSTTFAIGASYTAEENTKLKAAWESETPVVIKCQVTIGSQSYKSTCAVWNTVVTGTDVTIYVFVYAFGNDILQIYSADYGKTWGCNIQ